jgi:hypothetical protein
VIWLRFQLRRNASMSLHGCEDSLMQKTLRNNGLNVAFGWEEVYYLRVIEKYMTSIGVFRDQFKEIGQPDL